MDLRGMLGCVMLLAPLTGCADRQVPPPQPRKPPPVTVPAPTVSTADPAPEPKKLPPLVMRPVMEVATLLDLTESEQHVEVRVGHDPGGGMLGAAFWFMPLIDGKPDLTQQTRLKSILSTTASKFEIHGTRPNLYFHSYAGFRSAPADDHPDGLVGLSTHSWSKGRLLEWRGHAGMYALSEDALLPTFRVVRGNADEVPTLPAALAAKLTAAKFRTKTVSIAESGMVVAVGAPFVSLNFTTLIWDGDMSKPEVVVQSTDTLDGSEFQLIGATSRGNARLSTGAEVLRLDKDRWVVDDKLDGETPPDLWFGEPLLFTLASGVFARTKEGAAWRPVKFVPKNPKYEATFIIDDAGVVWTHEGETLYSTAAPATPHPPITIPILLETRKAAKLDLPTTSDPYSTSPFKVEPKDKPAP